METPRGEGTGRVDVRVVMREEPSGRWVARTNHPRLVVSAATRESCVASLRRGLALAASGGGPDERLTLVIEVLPRLAGVAEAARVMGWDKRRVITYIDRGRFPQPLQTLASGRVWLRSDVETFAAEWRARGKRRGRGH